MSVGSPTLTLKDRIESIRRRIDEAAVRAARSADSVRLVAATKTVAASTILEAGRLGVSEIGENRVQEAGGKRDALSGGPAFTHHFIGQLQTNKVRRAVELFDVIQSVDRMRLGEAVDRAAREAGKRQRCLVEVKISDDAAKGGVEPSAAGELIAGLSALEGIQLEGLMGIGPYGAGEPATRSAFRTLRRLFDENRAAFGPAPTLSMGMTDDFEVAVEEGSTMVRIGRLLFGERPRA